MQRSDRNYILWSELQRSPKCHEVYIYIIFYEKNPILKYVESITTIFQSSSSEDNLLKAYAFQTRIEIQNNESQNRNDNVRRWRFKIKMPEINARGNLF